jgi:deazaflavin-dependent oxidoreductase (nitroreductase family)
MAVRVPGKGTRGALFPKFMARLTNGLGVRRFRGGQMREVRGMPVLLLVTTGARSRRLRQTTLGYLAEPPDAWLVIASTGGSSWNPGWLYNLANEPDAVIELGDGRRVDVRAETLAGPDLEAAWRRIEAEAPQYAAYRSKTDREIQVVRLRERPATKSA